MVGIKAHPFLREGIMGILNEEHHGRLIKALDEISFTAGIPPAYIENTIRDYTDGKEIDWITNYSTNKTKYSGLVFLGVKKPEIRIMALCGALIRLFIDARVLSLGSLVPLKDGQTTSDATEPSVLLIPNL